MRLGPTLPRPDRNSRAHATVALAALLLIAFSGCSAAGVIRATPEASPTSAVSPTVARPTPRPLASPQTDSNLPRIERVTLASSVEQDGAPKDERSVFPEHPAQLYLCVEASALKANTTFRAVWYENGKIIGQSDVTAPADSANTLWVALRYSPVYALDPHVDHAVELVVNQTSIDRYAFRIGIGDARQVIAQATLATGTDANSDPVGASAAFYINVQQIVLWARISSEVDPTGMSFATTWYRGTTQIAQIGPDGGQPQLPPTPTPASRRMTFTFVPPAPLTPGGYHVDLYLNGQLIASYPFNITVEPPPTPTPRATATPTATPTEPPSTAMPTRTTQGATVNELVIAKDVDSDSHAPLGDPVETLEGDPQSLVKPWFAVKVANLTKDDTLEFVVTLNGGEYGTRKLKAAKVSDGWLAAHVDVDTPRADEQPYTYRVTVLLNGEPTLDATFTVSVANAQ
jgi:hypothetical protein